MKTLLLTLLGFCLATPLPAQGPADNPPTIKRTAEELAELLGPIALYPDALIALILPASTAPLDVVLGARYVAADGNPTRVEDKPWDSSVKALTRYPDTLKWLDENLEWTSQVGDAFIEQPVEVMESIQYLRAKARALGNLVDTPEQRIVQDETYIRIIPAQPNYIYEPRYDPEVIYYERPLSGPLLFFSVAYGVGSWLNYDCDWRHRRLYRGDWHEGWDYSRDRNHRDREDYLYINNNLTNSRVWRPDPVRHQVQRHRVTVERASNVGNSQSRAQSRDPGAGESRERHAGIAHPKPIVGAPHRGETVRRAEQRDGGKVGNQPSARTLHGSKSGEDPKGHIAAPRSAAPGLAGDGKRGSVARDRDDYKKPDKEPASVPRRADAPPKREAEAKAHADTPPPKRGSTKPEEPKHRIVPKQEEAQKHQDAPKRPEAARQEAPKREAAQKHQDTPKRPEATKHEAPKREEAKPHPESAKEKEKDHKGDKKKDEDKDKKK